jgi:hypothetical protein
VQGGIHAILALGQRGYWIYCYQILLDRPPTKDVAGALPAATAHATVAVRAAGEAHDGRASHRGSAHRMAIHEELA